MNTADGKDLCLVIFNTPTMQLTVSLCNSQLILQDTLDCFIVQHQEKLPKLVRGVSVTPFSVSVRTTPTALRALAATFRNDTTLLAATLVDIVAIDLVKSPGRFAVKYLFMSSTYNQRLSLELYVDEAGIIPSLATTFFNRQRIFASAGWLEREVWDLFGIYFSEHGDLRRILTDYGFTGHPLRKDFPLTGFQEVSYDDVEGRVVSGPVELSQELRVFVF